MHCQWRFLLDFQVFLPRASGNPQLGGGSPGTRQDAHRAASGGAGSSRAFGEPKGLLWGLSLCYFFGQAEQETSAALCCSWRDLQRAEEAPVRNGAGVALVRFNSCCFGWIPKDAFSASDDVEFGRFNFWGCGDATRPKTNGYRGASALATALSAWLLTVLGVTKENC